MRTSSRLHRRLQMTAASIIVANPDAQGPLREVVEQVQDAGARSAQTLQFVWDMIGGNSLGGKCSTNLF